jgi:hypothetical protein
VVAVAAVFPALVVVFLLLVLEMRLVGKLPLPPKLR